MTSALHTQPGLATPVPSPSITNFVSQVTCTESSRRGAATEKRRTTRAILLGSCFFLVHACFFLLHHVMLVLWNLSNVMIGKSPNFLVLRFNLPKFSSQIFFASISYTHLIDRPQLGQLGSEPHKFRSAFEGLYHHRLASPSRLQFIETLGDQEGINETLPCVILSYHVTFNCVCSSMRDFHFVAARKQFLCCLPWHFRYTAFTC